MPMTMPRNRLISGMPVPYQVGHVLSTGQPIGHHARASVDPGGHRRRGGRTGPVDNSAPWAHLVAGSPSFPTARRQEISQCSAVSRFAPPAPPARTLPQPIRASFTPGGETTHAGLQVRARSGGTHDSDRHSETRPPWIARRDRCAARDGRTGRRPCGRPRATTVGRRVQHGAVLIQ